MDEDRILDKLDDHTEKLTDLGATMRAYMANNNMLNESLTKSMKELGSEVAKIKLKDASSAHKCAEEIQKHEESAWSHNPKKALSLAGLVVGLVEGIRKFWPSH